MVRLAYGLEGFSDPGEQAAFAQLLPLRGGTRVLDIGVGGGRTTTILAPAASSYIGIDSDKRMVRKARARHPGVDIRVGDARDLEGFADASFDLVVFSFNGVDCLAPDDRAAFFRASIRVLRPGGVLLFSTHNLDGPSYAQSPSRADLGERFAVPGLLARAKTVLGGIVRLGFARYHYRRNTRLARVGADWATAPLRSHEFRFVVHFVRFGAAREQVAACGFDVERAWTNSGAPLELTATRHDEHYVHLLCRRHAVGAPSERSQAGHG